MIARQPVAPSTALYNNNGDANMLIAAPSTVLFKPVKMTIVGIDLSEQSTEKEGRLEDVVAPTATTC